MDYLSSTQHPVCSQEGSGSFKIHYSEARREREQKSYTPFTVECNQSPVSVPGSVSELQLQENQQRLIW